MRRQMNGLSIMVREEMKEDPQCGDLFVFRNKRKDMVKVLFFDQQGYCLLAKRLDRGVFRIDVAGDHVAIEISASDLASLLSNADIVQRNARAA